MSGNRLNLGVGVLLAAALLTPAARRLAAARTITVAADGTGDVKTLAEAIAAVPDRAAKRTTIHLRAGSYLGQTVVPRAKANVTFEGDGPGKTVVTFAYNQNEPQPPGTDRQFPGIGVVVQAEGFVARELTFDNASRPQPETTMTNDTPLHRDQIPSTVDRALAAQPVRDMHTHLYPPAFGTPVPNAGRVDPAGLLLWGVDELVTYHYLVAEVYRVVPATTLPYEQFWRMTKRQQADHIWRHLFVERTPLSEACRGVLTTLQKLGLDPNEKTLDPYRTFFDQQDPSAYIDRVMGIANVSSITMTNPVFDDNERARWLADGHVGVDPRFKAVLRIDPLLRAWPTAARKLAGWGYAVAEELTDATVEAVRGFLREWIDRQKAIYLAVSLPPEFRFPAEGADPVAVAGTAVLERCVLPVCAERGLPFAMMIGSRMRVNPALGDAGDMSGKADVMAVVNLCQRFPANKFLVTMLARENQHELCVAARKFGNLMVFGCWWFLNNPSLIAEIERMRVELLGTSFIPQHSDARVLDQLVYKWEHSRRVLSAVLAEKYADLTDTGRRLTEADVARDVRLMLEGNFTEFLAR